MLRATRSQGLHYRIAQEIYSYMISFLDWLSPECPCPTSLDTHRQPSREYCCHRSHVLAGDNLRDFESPLRIGLQNAHQLWSLSAPHGPSLHLHFERLRELSKVLPAWRQASAH